MCIITALATAAAAIGTAVSSAVSAVGSFLGTTLFTVGGGVVTSGGAAGAVAGGTSITVGGALAGIGLAAGAAMGINSMYQSARQSAKAQQAQADAIKKLQENQGQPEVSRVTNGLQEGSRINRTLSSLRISMLPQKQNNENITQNVYGVDSNTVVTSTQNMTGLNIAA